MFPVWPQPKGWWVHRVQLLCICLGETEHKDLASFPQGSLLWIVVRAKLALYFRLCVPCVTAAEGLVVRVLYVSFAWGNGA